MGYFANATWDLTFHSEEAIHACAAEAGNTVAQLGDARHTVGDVVAGFHAVSDLTWDGLRLSGTGGNKAYIEPAFYQLLASYASGTVDWHSVDDAPLKLWRVRFTDGMAHEYRGEVVYPDDQPNLTYAFNPAAPYRLLQEITAELRREDALKVGTQPVRVVNLVVGVMIDWIDRRLDVIESSSDSDDWTGEEVLAWTGAINEVKALFTTGGG